MQLVLQFLIKSFTLLPLQTNEIQIKDLCHVSLLEKDKFYSTFRSTKEIVPQTPFYRKMYKCLTYKYKTYRLITLSQSITSTEIFLLDSLNLLFNIQKELMRINNQRINKKDLLMISDLLRWDRETYKFQQKFYNQYQCDELNLFLFMKDSTFFQTVILDHIKNKIEKSFIDYFLLQDHIALSKYEQVQLFQQLNGMEQALLVIYNQEIAEKKEEAQILAKYLQQNFKTIVNKQDDDKYKLLFDTILGVEKQLINQKNQEQEKKSQEQEKQVQKEKNNPAQQQFKEKSKEKSLMLQRKKKQLKCEDYEDDEDDIRSISRSSSSSSISRSSSSDQREKMSYIECVLPRRGGSRTRQTARKSTAGCVSKGKGVRRYESMRKTLIESFQTVEATKEYCEKHYSVGMNQSQYKQLIKVSEFFIDLANHSIQKGYFTQNFISSSFMYCTSNFTEIMSVLALISLQQQKNDFNQYHFNLQNIHSNNQGIREQNQFIQLLLLYLQRRFKKLKCNLILELLQIKPSLILKMKKLMINAIMKRRKIQIIFQLKMFMDVKQLFLIVQQFHKHFNYKQKIQLIFTILMEIPNGSIPVQTTFSTKTLTLNCAPYQTVIQTYFFYFPKSGNFTIYPANISKLGKVIQIAKEKIFNVYDEKAKVNLENINEVLQTDNNDDILNYIENKNIFNTKLFNPKLLYHKFKDEVFYRQVMQIYKKRKFYDFNSFAFSLLHNNVEYLKEFFMTKEAQNSLKQYFKHFKCSLFEINSVNILEYYPLISKRVHKLQKGENNILNVQFRKQYIKYLIYLLEKPQFSTIDKLERVNEAVQVYSQINEEEQKEQQLQFDYLTAYLDFYTGYPNFQKGRVICKKYLSYPVIHWRNMFYEMINLLIEYDGEEDNQFSKLEISQEQKQKDFISKEETLACSIEGDYISLTFSNLSEVKIEYYKLDIEILFSNNPFMKNIIQDFSIVLPNLSQNQKIVGQEIQKNLYQQKIQIPNEISKENLFVTIKGQQKQVTCKYQPTSLFVQTMVDSGQIRVFNQQGQYSYLIINFNVYLSKVYVKVYSKNKDNAETFYKDGYTDLRGRFDYASLSSSNFKEIEKFSMLIYHEELGSIIQQVSPPPTLAQYEKEIHIIGNKWREQEREEYQNKRIVQQTFQCGKGGKIGKIATQRNYNNDRHDR